MQMTFRWYGEGNDSITLKQIRQIPGIKGVVWALHDVPVGEVWPVERIEEVVKQAKEYELNTEVVESVNIHEDIKLGLPTRDHYIQTYKQTLKNLSQFGVKVVCYNFMPVFDWFRTDLFKEMEDGSTALFFDAQKVLALTPEQVVKNMEENQKDFTLPGWEPERLTDLQRLFDLYKDITEVDLLENLTYFLKEVCPVAEECGIKMAIHPDDPPFSIFGLPRIVKNKEDIGRLLRAVDSPANGLTFCSGSLGGNLANDLVDIVNSFADRIAFAHIRNVKHFEDGSFIESAHRVEDGSLPITGIINALHENGFDGYIRPDHGRHIWDEVCRPGYGLYDRALGAMYLQGAWDTNVLLKNGAAPKKTMQTV
ncbi:mannonate dehydratase [Neobacillus sp. MER 74]|uniref:mannonate dehydratase n=1 Tax=Neobacillus sp. MER 74 TaxID=2939566 RepID=UPI00203CCC6F|nr:mannonate dehydratase [Neobacillus sp. MER 74]MCM3117240.1 mannonate dehydratase [Neobacillus sp. MER 74]